MTVETDAPGGRLPLVDPAAFTGAQRQLFDRVTATRERRANDAGFRITTPDCGMPDSSSTPIRHWRTRPACPQSPSRHSSAVVYPTNWMPTRRSLAAVRSSYRPAIASMTSFTVKPKTPSVQRDCSISPHSSAFTTRFVPS
jgi:hypothetical protein